MRFRGLCVTRKMVEIYINQLYVSWIQSTFSSHLHFLPDPITHMSLRYLNAGFKNQEHGPKLFFEKIK